MAETISLQCLETQPTWGVKLSESSAILGPTPFHDATEILRERSVWREKPPIKEVLS